MRLELSFSDIDAIKSEKGTLNLRTKTYACVVFSCAWCYPSNDSFSEILIKHKPLLTIALYV
jgi:hypothetical protein